MPAATTFSTPDGKPNEERKKVSSLTGPAVARAQDPKPDFAPAVTPAVPLSERLRGLLIVTRTRSAIASIANVFARIVSFSRAVGHAPGAGARLASQGVRAAKDEASARARSAMSHRRVWLSAAWLLSALSSALLFSAALHASFAASIVVVASIAIFNGLTAAITANASDRQAHGMRERSGDEHVAERSHVFVPAPEQSPQSAELVGRQAH
ncbi:MAG: hypothetical protein ABI864_05550 [Chloroflexota bacterium]